MTVRAVLVALLVSAVACGGGASSTPTPIQTQPSAEEASKPSVEITYPAERGDPLPSGDVLVALTVRAFGIVDEIGSKPQDGKGHVVYYLDVPEIPSRPGASALAEQTGRSAASARTSHTWTDVAPGRHSLGVQLVNNDDTPLEPPVTDEIEIVVGG